ncbi:hypothetical protein BGC_01690 [Burkholderia sp. 3C]
MTDSFAKRKRAIALLILLLLVLAATTAYLLRPRYTPAERDHYTALFCHVVTTGGSHDADKTMRAIVENGNADYALSKIEYNAAAAQDAISRFAKLDAGQQHQAQQNSADCERLLGLAAR